MKWQENLKEQKASVQRIDLGICGHHPKDKSAVFAFTKHSPIENER